MRVISNKGAEYTVHDLVRNQNIPDHVSRLKRFENDTIRVDPLHVAAKDNEEVLNGSPRWAFQFAGQATLIAKSYDSKTSSIPSGQRYGTFDP